MVVIRSAGTKDLNGQKGFLLFDRTSVPAAAAWIDATSPRENFSACASALREDHRSEALHTSTGKIPRSGDDERHDDWNRLPTELLHPDHLSPQPRRARPCIQHHSSGTGIWSVLSCSDYTTGIAPSCTLWMFAPPFRPPDLVRRAGGLHDDPLIGGSERSSLEAGQRGFDEPRFEDDPYGLAVGIKFPGHPQR